MTSYDYRLGMKNATSHCMKYTYLPSRVVWKKSFFIPSPFKTVVNFFYLLFQLVRKK